MAMPPPPRSETLLARATRHVREGQARIDRQQEIVAEMVRDHHPHAAEQAETVLRTLLDTQRLMQAHLTTLQTG